jgi:hypothetical protein
MKKSWKGRSGIQYMPSAIQEDDSSLKHYRDSSSSGYLLFRFARKPVIAVPDSSQKVKLASLKCYRGITIRRRSFAYMTRLLTRLRVDRLLTQPVDSSLSSLLPFNFQDLLDTLRKAIGAPDAQAVMVWPPQSDRGRIYIHLLDADGRPLAFVKLAMDALNDKYLHSEAQTIKKMEALELTSFQIPSLIEIRRWNGHFFCIFEPIATDAKPVKHSWSSFPRDCVKEYAGHVRVIGHQQLKKLDWWRNFWKVTPLESAFAQDVRIAQEQPIRVCRAHGDLGTMNMIRVDGQILIFDWEECCDDAPILTDELMFFLVLNQRKFIAKPLAGLRDLAQRYLFGASVQRRCDVIMALAFIHASDKPVATKVLSNWARLNDRA